MVSNGIVMGSSDEAEVGQVLDAALPFLSKLALITAGKDGVLRQQPILDCSDERYQ